MMAPVGNASGNGQEEYLLEFEKPLAANRRHVAELEADQQATNRDHSSEIRRLHAEYNVLLEKIYSNLTPWQTVQVARHPRRPLAMDYIERIVREFVELHGDRAFGDDRAIRCGMGRVATEKVVIIAQHKGRDTQEKIECNFGCAHPEGYRKALRVMKLAEKFSLPVITFIDTPGAYPGIGSEERGVAQAIAMNLREMSRLRTPIICIVIGEGGSGGALGIGVGDKVVILQYAYYSVISPEGCAAILWKTGEKAAEAAQAMKITAKDLEQLGVIDEIIPEPLGGAHRDPAQAASNVEHFIIRALRELRSVNIDTLNEKRYQRWRKMGQVLHAQPSYLPEQKVIRA